MMKFAAFAAILSLTSGQLLWQRYYNEWPQVVTVPRDLPADVVGQLFTFGYINSPSFVPTGPLSDTRKFITAKYNSGFNTGFTVTTFTPQAGWVLVTDPLTMNYRQSRPVIGSGTPTFTGNADINTAFEFERQAVVVSTSRNMQTGIPNSGLGLREGDIIILHTTGAGDFNTKCFGHPQIVLNSAAQTIALARVYCLVAESDVRVRVQLDAKSGDWNPNSVVVDYTIHPLPYFITNMRT